MCQQISPGSWPKWFAALFFSVCGFLGCVSDPDHQAPPRLVGPPSPTQSAGETRGVVGTSFDVLFLGSKMILRPSIRPKDVGPDGPSIILIGIPLKDRAVFLDQLQLDQLRTGEEDYRFMAHADPTNAWKNADKSNLGGTLTGDLWRGHPARGGTLIIKSMGFAQVSLHRTETKRPIPEHLRDKVYTLVSTDRHMLAIPLFVERENHGSSLRMRLRELRGDPAVQKWLLEEPQLVVFQTTPEIAPKGPEQRPFLQAKIRIRGKFYASTFELIPPP